MEEPSYNSDLDWARQVILLGYLVAFGICLAWYFEWLRKAREYNEHRDKLWTIKNLVEAAMLPLQNQPATSPTRSATQIEGHCLFSWLADVNEQEHGSRFCDCNLGQCDKMIQREKKQQEAQNNAVSTEQSSTTNNATRSSKEIDKVKHYLVDAEDTHLLIQERHRQKQVENAEATRQEARADHEDTKSKFEVTEAKLTKTKNQLGIKDTEPEEAKKPIEVFKNQVHTVPFADQRQRENNGLRAAQSGLASTVDQLRQSRIRLTEEVKLRKRELNSTEEIEKLEQRRAELEGEIDQMKKSLNSENQEIEQFKEAMGLSGDDLKQAFEKTRNACEPTNSKESPEEPKDLTLGLQRTETYIGTSNDSTPLSNALAKEFPEQPADSSLENQPSQQMDVILLKSTGCKTCGIRFATRYELSNHTRNCKARCKDCGAVVDEFKGHKKTCLKWLVGCTVCQEKVTRDELQDHEQECKSKRKGKPCNYCQEAISDIQPHLKTCSKGPQKGCNRCGMMVLKAMLGDHLKTQCMGPATPASVAAACTPSEDLSGERVT